MTEQKLPLTQTERDLLFMVLGEKMEALEKSGDNETSEVLESVINNITEWYLQLTPWEPTVTAGQIAAGRDAILASHANVIGNMQAENLAFTVLVAARVKSKTEGSKG